MRSLKGVGTRGEWIKSRDFEKVVLLKSKKISRELLENFLIYRVYKIFLESKMRFKKEDTRLLVESWRNIVKGNISESMEEEMSTKMPMNCCGSQMTHHIDVPMADVLRYCGSVEDCEKKVENAKNNPDKYGYANYDYEVVSPGKLEVMGQTVRMFGDDADNSSAEDHWNRCKGFTVSDSFAGTSSFHRR